jgi:hypothetical protein
MFQPPSITWAWPLVNDDSSPAKYTASAAISAGVPTRPMRKRATNASRLSTSVMPAAAAWMRRLTMMRANVSSTAY